VGALTVALGLAAACLSGLPVLAATQQAALSPRIQGIDAPAARATVSLDRGWRFKQDGALSGVENSTFDDSAWPTVELPHTWNRLGNAGTERSLRSNLVQGVGWYRLRFTIPPALTGPKRYFLQFEGVGAIADVWLNGRYLGKHAGAFSKFRFDATGAIKSSGDNLLVVKADNSRPQPGSSTAEVIPLSGDFFVFGGIYRGVALVATDPVHVDMLDYGGPGVYARALSIDANAATVELTGRLVNDGLEPAVVGVEATIQDAAGKTVGSSSRQVTLPAVGGTGPGKAVEPTFISLTLRASHPRLWQGTKDPYLYRTVFTLRSRGGAVLDRVTEPLGLRTLAFDADKGFFLNGEHLFLRGVSMHQDRAEKGWAISAEDQAQDFDFLTDMGANAVRLAHYQHDQRSYQLADERGIITWAEIPLVNHVAFDGGPASAALSANARQQLLELIRQNYNHPSIAVWSIGNEVDLRVTQGRGPSKPRTLLETLNHLAKSEDPSRFTTLADCCEEGLPPHTQDPVSSRDVIVGLTDVVGYNRYFGWYSGSLADLGPMLDAAHLRHPKLPLALSEFGAGAALTQHSDDPSGGPFDPHGRPHPEEYQSLYHEASWNTLRTRSYLWGVFIWNLFDFASDSRREGDLTDINDKGLVSYDRTVVKDAFYFYRANWSARPTLHLVGRRYTDRAHAILEVKAYSNARQAQLWLNGVAQGTSTCSEGICQWHHIHLTPGTNEVRATAHFGGSEVSDTLQWTFHQTP
jgi:beta-galactosidase